MLPFTAMDSQTDLPGSLFRCTWHLKTCSFKWGQIVSLGARSINSIFEMINSVFKVLRRKKYVTESL